MFLAYKQLRANSSQSQYACVKFQLWSWWINIKYWPSRTYHRYFMRKWAKKDPKELQQILDEIKKLLGE